MAKDKKIAVEKGGKLNEKPEQPIPDESVMDDIKVDENGIPDMTEEQKQFARMTVRKEFNEKFSKWAEIADEDATDEDIEEIKKEFEACLEENKNKTYKLASHEDGLALKTAEFLYMWNTQFNTWEKGSWRGVIHFDKVIKETVEDLKANLDKDFEVDYSTLIFLYQSMMDPKGMGLESAKAMAKFENYNEETGKPYEENIPVTYSGILEKVMIEVQQLSNIDKKLNILKERVNLAYAGLKMNLKINRIEEFLEFHDAITADNVDQDPDVQAAMKS